MHDVVSILRQFWLSIFISLQIICVKDREILSIMSRHKYLQASLWTVLKDD